MIVVTGGDGFIGKALIEELKNRNYLDVLSLDIKNMELSLIYNWLIEHNNEIDYIFHLGAITDTTEMNISKFDEYNVDFSIFIWSLCVSNNIPLIYASSASTYGNGNYGFDDEINISNLCPLHPYGWSKQQFDMWVIEQEKKPSFWCGLKFFNVYGYDESHKGKMSSVAYQLFNQLEETGGMKLFKSHNPKFKDGEQLRDFIYVNDVIDVCIYMMENKPKSGLYNVGTGKARTFKDVAKSVYSAYYDLNTNDSTSFEDTSIKIKIAFEFTEKLLYIDMPPKIRNKYQYITEAKIEKLRNAGYITPFTELENGINEYILKLKNKKK